MGKKSHRLGFIKQRIVPLVSLFLGFCAPLFADFTHDAGEVFTVTSTTDSIYPMIWPYTQSSAQSLLFSMDFLTAVNSAGHTGITASYTANSSLNTYEDGTTETSRTFYTSSVADYSLSTEQIVKTYATSLGLKTNSVEIQYKVTNTSSDTIDELYLGNYFDFDLPEISTNSVGYDSARKMYYSRTADSSIFVGIRVLSGTTHSAHFRSWGNSFNRTYTSVTDGVQDTSVDTAAGLDVTFTVSQKYTNVRVNSTVSYAVGIFFGESLADIQSVSDAAFSQYGGLGGSGLVIVKKESVAEGPASFSTSPSSSGGGCLLKP